MVLHLAKLVGLIRMNYVYVFHFHIENGGWSFLRWVLQFDGGGQRKKGS